jgi:lipoprotein-releasing system ATP-binding protein
MAEPAIAARGLRKSYGSGESAVAVLRGVELILNPGEFAAVLGPSGSGKSTLLNLLGLMDRPDAGTLSLGGEDAGSLDDDGRARVRNARLGFVFQFDSLLPEFTILENVLMPARIARARSLSADAPARDLARAEILLESLGITKLAARFPSQTSGGERQRAAIARALIQSPSVILADEPTGNLDRENGAKVFADFKRLAREKNAAVILVTHDETQAKTADRILRMNDGLLL